VVPADDRGVLALEHAVELDEELGLLALLGQEGRLRLLVVLGHGRVGGVHVVHGHVLLLAAPLAGQEQALHGIQLDRHGEVVLGRQRGHDSVELQLSCGGAPPIGGALGAV
jgi:hypothetical protein